MPEPSSVVDLYDVGDEAPSIATPQPVAAASPSSTPSEAATPPTEPKPTPPRDPATGQFLPRTPAHPKLLVQTARDLGLDEDEIQATPTAELRELVRDAVTAQSLLRRETTIDHVLDRPREPASQPVSPPVQEPASSSQSAATVASPAAADDLGLDESQYDPGLIGVLKAQAKTIKELQERVGHLHNYAKQQVEQSATQKIDGEFAALGGHFEKLLGKGPRSAFADTAPEHIRRKAVVAEAARLAGPKANVDQVVAKIGEAAKIMFGLQMPEPPKPTPVATTVPATVDRVEQWRNGGLAVPTHRGGSVEPPGPDKAEKAAAAFLQDNGLDTGTEAIEDL